MTVHRFRLGGTRELRVARTATGLVALAIHDAERCVSGPMALPVDQLAVLLHALEKLTVEIGQDQQTKGAP